MVLDAALRQASETGFESLTIGTLAERVGLVEERALRPFRVARGAAGGRHRDGRRALHRDRVPAGVKARRGLPRLRALFDNWFDWTARSGLTHGCPMQAAAVEFDDRPGPVRDAVVEHFARLERELGRAVELAIGQGHLRADLDVGQFVFDMMGIIFAYYHGARLFEGAKAQSRARAAFERLVAAASPTA